jgi:hypothetical protein
LLNRKSTGWPPTNARSAHAKEAAIPFIIRGQTLFAARMDMYVQHQFQSTARPRRSGRRLLVRDHVNRNEARRLGIALNDAPPPGVEA